MTGIPMELMEKYDTRRKGRKSDHVLMADIVPCCIEKNQSL